MFELFVLGTTSLNLIGVERTSYITGLNNWSAPSRVSHKVNKVVYECFEQPTIFFSYAEAKEILEEIKERRDEISFQNESVIGQVLDEQHGFEFPVEQLQIFKMSPTPITEEDVREYEREFAWQREKQELEDIDQEENLEEEQVDDDLMI